jgi:outer membrane receptor for monomeric catechols
MVPTGNDNMSGGMLRTVTIALAAVCFSYAAIVADGARSRQTARSISAAPHKADRLASPPAGQSDLDTPGQVTVLTRQILDDKNATSLKDALGSTAGVTVGR